MEARSACRFQFLGLPKQRIRGSEKILREGSPEKEKASNLLREIFMRSIARAAGGGGDVSTDAVLDLITTARSGFRL